MKRFVYLYATVFVLQLKLFASVLHRRNLDYSSTIRRVTLTIPILHEDEKHEAVICTAWPNSILAPCDIRYGALCGTCDSVSRCC